MDMILCKCESGTELNGSQMLVKCWMHVFEQEKHLNIQKMCCRRATHTRRTREHACPSQLNAVVEERPVIAACVNDSHRRRCYKLWL